MKGTVYWYNPELGAGYITPDDGSANVFAHDRDVNMGGYRHLSEGQRVEFDVTYGQKGPQAVNIRPAVS